MLYPIPPETSPWAYNRILDVCYVLNFKTTLVYKPTGPIPGYKPMGL